MSFFYRYQEIIMLKYLDLKLRDLLKKINFRFLSMIFKKCFFNNFANICNYDLEL